MSNSKKLLDDISSLQADYKEIETYCHDKALKPFDKDPPTPEIAKWRFQTFLPEECEELAEGNLKLADYQKVPFGEPRPQKPSIPILSVIAVVFLALAVVMLGLLIGKYVALGKIDELDSGKGEIEYAIMTTWSALISFSLIFAGLEIFRIVKHKDGLIAYFKGVKRYPQVSKDYDARRNEYLAEQEQEKQRYDEDVEAELVQYKERYAAYEQEYEEYNKTQKQKQRELAVKYAAVADRILAHADMPIKYKEPFDIDFKNVQNVSDFYTYTVAPLQAELKSIADIIKAGRADTLKEAIDCFLKDKALQEQREAEEEQNRYARQQAEQQAEIQKKQLEAQQEQIKAQKEAARSTLEAQIAQLKVQRQSITNRRINASPNERVQLRLDEDSLTRQIHDLESKLWNI